MRAASRCAGALALALVAGLGVDASLLAQGGAANDAPLDLLVADVHGSIVPFGQNAELAVGRGLDPTTQPGLGLGLSVGAHVYLLRLGFVTIGLGASVHRSVGDKRPGEDAADPDGPVLRQRFTAVAPQLSLNFGGHDGWSYLSGGPGRSRLSLFDRDGGAPAQQETGTFNYGGGARWFTSEHLAFSLDLRFYNASPIPATPSVPGSPRMTIMVLNVGASFK